MMQSSLLVSDHIVSFFNVFKYFTVRGLYYQTASIFRAMISLMMEARNTSETRKQPTL